MTLVECFDNNPIKNILGCLRHNPERVIFIGKEDQLEEPVKILCRIMNERGVFPEIVMRYVREDTPAAVLEILTDIVNNEFFCVIDLNGGEENVIAAVGALWNGLTESQKSRVSIQGYNQFTEQDVDLDGNGRLICGDRVTLSAEELVVLHGGVIYPGLDNQYEEYTVKHIEPIWRLMNEDPTAWNKAIMVLNEFESYNISDKEIFVNYNVVSQKIDGYAEKERMLFSILTMLENNRIIYNTSYANVLRYRYVNELYRYCMRKAGNILELKTLLEAREAMDGDERLFDSCYMGVNIDWDGVIRQHTERIWETRNEIDVLAVRGVTPLYISCKNGGFHEDELYKLDAVARRFGGANARKAIVLPNKANLSEPLERRARDMDIYIIDNAAELDAESWSSELKKAMRI